MLVRFRSGNYPDITYFGDIAIRLLTMMGHSGTIPGAIHANDVSAAIENLRAQLAEQGDSIVAEADNQEDAFDNSNDVQISLRHRAFPLMEMLESAQDHNDDILWRHI